MCKFVLPLHDLCEIQVEPEDRMSTASSEQILQALCVVTKICRHLPVPAYFHFDEGVLFHDVSRGELSKSIRWYKP